MCHCSKFIWCHSCLLGVIRTVIMVIRATCNVPVIHKAIIMILPKTITMVYVLTYVLTRKCLWWALLLFPIFEQSLRSKWLFHYQGESFKCIKIEAFLTRQDCVVNTNAVRGMILPRNRDIQPWELDGKLPSALVLRKKGGESTRPFSNFFTH